MKFFLIILILISLNYCSNYRLNEIRMYEINKNEKSIILALNKSSDPYVRSQAVQSLGRLKSKIAFPHIIKSLTDKDWGVRLYSAQALRQISNPKAIPALKKQLKIETDLYVIKDIQKTLNKLKKEKILPKLLN